MPNLGNEIYHGKYFSVYEMKSELVGTKYHVVDQHTEVRLSESYDEMETAIAKSNAMDINMENGILKKDYLSAIRTTIDTLVWCLTDSAKDKAEVFLPRLKNAQENLSRAIEMRERIR